jgi:hypothetical protein
MVYGLLEGLTVLPYETIREVLNPEDESSNFVRNISKYLLLTGRYIPEDLILYEYRYEDLKCRI